LRVGGENKEYRIVVFEIVQKHNDRVVDSPVDNLMAEFASVVDSVECTIKIQEVPQAKNDELPENRRMMFRFGINLGDVNSEEGRIYGDRFRKSMPAQNIECANLQVE
jgi:adenylate cyclase